jgi:molybdopterin molybdotransferase
VVPVEDAELEGGQVRLPAAPPGAHVRRAGTDLRAGDRVAAAGSLIGPVDVGLLAGAGAATVSVHRRPRVAVVSTGDELVDVDRRPARGQVRDSNGPLVGALARVGGARADLLERAGDRDADLASRLEAALAAEIVVTTGGVSVGGYDRVRDVLASLGVEEVFWRIALKPGKPLWFGRRGGTRVLGLPGNPVSAAVCGWLFLVPLCRALSGRSEPRLRRVTARLVEPRTGPSGRTEAVRARLSTDGDGVLWAAPTDRRQASYVTSSLRGGEALVMVGGGAAVTAGAPCDAWLLA